MSSCILQVTFPISVSVTEVGKPVALLISGSGDADDTISVTIANLPAGAFITDGIDSMQFSRSPATLTQAEVNSGLTLHWGVVEAGATLSLTASKATAGETTPPHAETRHLSQAPSAP